MVDFIYSHNKQTTCRLQLHGKKRSPHLWTGSHGLVRAVLGWELFYLPSPDKSGGLTQLEGHRFSDLIPSLFPLCVQHSQALRGAASRDKLCPSAFIKFSAGCHTMLIRCHTGLPLPVGNALFLLSIVYVYIRMLLC